MPRKIDDIKKELELKRKTVAKTDETIKKMEERVKEAAKKVSELRPKIDELRKLIVLNEKALKDPKTKKENKAGLTKQKTDAEKKVGPMETELESNTQVYEATKKNIELLKQKDGPIYQKIEELEKELEEAEKGVKEFGESRTEFKKWYEGELKKMKAFVDHANKAASVAEQIRAAVVKAIELGAMEKAQLFVANAKKAATAAEVAETGILKAHEDVNPNKTKQRNLSPKTFNVTNVDVKVHDVLTKSIYALFALEDRWVNEVRVKAAEAKECAEEAETWLAAGSRDVKGYEKVLTNTLATARKMAVELDGLANRTWGQIIMNEGEKLAEMAGNFKKDATTWRGPAIKMVEQASAYVPETLERVRAGVGRIETSCKKAVDSVPGQWKAPLGGLLSEFTSLAEKQAELLKLFIAKAQKTTVQIDSLRDLVEE